MSCNCITPIVAPSGECLPLVSDDCAVARDTSTCVTCPTDENCLVSDQSDGTTLGNTWLDACCYSDGVTLLGRVGSKLARLAGSGFIKLTNGVASVVPSVPLSVSTLWHNFWKTSPTRRPILGAPLPYTYAVVGDAQGNIHGIKGPSDESAVGVWNSDTKEYTQLPLSELPLPRKGVLARATDIELTGYKPIDEDGAATDIRPQKVLSGKGVVFLTEVDTIDSTCECADQNGTASVASTVAFPTGSGVFLLKYSVADGLYFEEE